MDRQIDRYIDEKRNQTRNEIPHKSIFFVQPFLSHFFAFLMIYRVVSCALYYFFAFFFLKNFHLFIIYTFFQLFQVPTCVLYVLKLLPAHEFSCSRLQQLLAPFQAAPYPAVPAVDAAAVPAVVAAAVPAAVAAVAPAVAAVDPRIVVELKMKLQCIFHDFYFKMWSNSIVYRSSQSFCLYLKISPHIHTSFRVVIIDKLIYLIFIRHIFQ